MVFDKENVRNKLDPNLNKLYGVKLAKYISENYISHNHYNLGLELAETNFFKTYHSKLPDGPPSWENAVPIYDKVRKELMQINELILEKKKLTKPILIKILKGLVTHMCALDKTAPDYFRFGIDKWRGDNFSSQLDKLEKTFEVINTIDQNLDKPDIGGFQYKYWNDTMSDLWACAYAGLYEEALYLIDVLERLIIKINDGSCSNPVFPKVLDQGTNARFLMSLYMLRTKIYKVQNKIDLAIKDYKTIVSFSNLNSQNNADRSYLIWWFTGLNRVTEAAIEIYKLKPTEENKQQCIDLYIHCCNFNSFDNTESTRERGLITYMLMKYVLDIEVK